MLNRLRVHHRHLFSLPRCLALPLPPSPLPRSLATFLRRSSFARSLPCSLPQAASLAPSLPRSKRIDRLPPYPLPLPRSWHPGRRGPTRPRSRSPLASESIAPSLPRSLAPSLPRFPLLWRGVRSLAPLFAPSLSRSNCIDGSAFLRLVRRT